MYTPPPDLDWKTYAVVVGQRVKALRTDWVNGRVTNMSMEHVYRLAYALDVPPIVLLPDVEKEVVPRCRAAEHREPMSSLMRRTIEIDVAWPRGLRVVNPGKRED
jgi:hypothetical protein